MRLIRLATRREAGNDEIDHLVDRRAGLGGALRDHLRVKEPHHRGAGTERGQLQGKDGDKAQAWLTLGEVVAVHIDKAFIQDGVYQTGLAHPIVRAGRRGDYFEIKPENMVEMIRPD